MEHGIVTSPRPIIGLSAIEDLESARGAGFDHFVGVPLALALPGVKVQFQLLVIHPLDNALPPAFNPRYRSVIRSACCSCRPCFCPVFFVSPIILALLVPWALFALWVFIGRRPRVNVSFLPLWDAPEELRRPRNKAFQPPPLAVVLAILSLLMIILAAARPALKSRGERTVTLIVDRGATMSALGPAGRPRYVEAAELLVQDLLALDPPVRLRGVVVPALKGEFSDAASVHPAEWVALIAQLPRTAADTQLELQAAALRPQVGQTLILTDRDPRSADAAQFIAIAPPPAAGDAGIVGLAARDGQAMVTLTSTVAVRRTLRLTTNKKSIDTPVTIEPHQPRTLFIPLAPLGPTIQASLLSDDGKPDALDANDTAWLVRQRSWAAVEEQTPLPEEVRRVLAVYRRHRAAEAGAPVIAVARLLPGVQSPRASEPAILMADGITNARTLTGEIRAEAHPGLPADLDWSELAQNLTVAPSPGEGWKPILTLTAAGVVHPLIAIRETAGVRQAWIGFDSASLAQSPAFVILWGSLLDWVAAAPNAGAEEYQARVLGGSASASTLNESAALERMDEARRLSPLPPDADPRYWPGLFESRDGGVFAVNAPVIAFGSLSPNDWRSRLSSLPTPGDIDLASPLCLVGLLLLASSAATWERRRAPATSALAPHVDAEIRQRTETTFEADGHVHRHTHFIPPK